MSAHQGMIEIDEVINSYLNRSEQSNHKYFKCWHIAFEGMDQMGLDVFYRVRSVKLPVNSNLTVYIPNDYLQWSKIGVLNDRGEIIPMAQNDKLTTFADLNPNRLQKTQDNTLDNFLQFGNNIWYNYWNGDSFVTLYGLPSGSPFVGSFKMDLTNGVILLNERFPYNYLMVEYIASPQEGGKYYIPLQFREALIWFIAWQDIGMMPNTRRGNLGDKEQRKRNHFNERRKAIAEYKPYRVEEAYEWALENQRMCVKA